MKLPLSQLSRQDLEKIFENSSLKEQKFFPRKVPSLLDFKKEPIQLTESSNRNESNEVLMEKN